MRAGGAEAPARPPRSGWGHADPTNQSASHLPEKTPSPPGIERVHVKLGQEQIRAGPLTDTGRPTHANCLGTREETLHESPLIFIKAGGEPEPR